MLHSRDKSQWTKTMSQMPLNIHCQPGHVPATWLGIVPSESECQLSTPRSSLVEGPGSLCLTTWVLILCCTYWFYPHEVHVWTPLSYSIIADINILDWLACLSWFHLNKGVIAVRGSVAVAVVVSDRWHVTHDSWNMTCDKGHMTHNFVLFFLYFFLVLVLLSPYVKIFSVSRMQDFFCGPK